MRLKAVEYNRQKADAWASSLGWELDVLLTCADGARVVLMNAEGGTPSHSTLTLTSDIDGSNVRLSIDNVLEPHETEALLKLLADLNVGD